MAKERFCEILIWVYLGWCWGWGTVQLADFYADKYLISRVLQGGSLDRYYPWLTAFVLVGTGSFFSGNVSQLIWWELFLILQTTSIYFDLVYQILPLRLSGLAWLLGCLYQYIQNQLESGLISSLAIGIFLLTLYLVARGMMGGGDPWFAASIAVWMDIWSGIYLLWLSSFLGLVFVGILYLSGNYRKGIRIPYGPFLSLAAFMIMFWQWEWWLK